MTKNHTFAYGLVCGTVLSWLAAGCSAQGNVGDAAIDAVDEGKPVENVTEDTGRDQVEPENQAPLVKFLPSAGDDQPAIYLHAVAAEPSVLALELVAQKISNVYGIAYRLEYDPTLLQLTAADATTSMPARRLVLAREPRPGLLFGVLTAKGPFDGVSAPSATSLGTLRFAVLTQGETPVRFVAERCRAQDSTGAAVANLAWRGGTLRSE